MSAIESIRQRPKTVAAVTAVLVLGAIGLAVFSLPSPKASVQTDTPKAFFTTDDGTTWFPDDATKLVPFSKDGKDAVRVHLFTPGAGKPPIVGYLERLSPQALSQITALRGKPNAEYQVTGLEESGLELKRKGDPAWISASTPEAAKLRRPPTAPNGEELSELAP